MQILHQHQHGIHSLNSRKRNVALALAVTLAMSLAACGSDDSDSAEPPSSAAATAVPTATTDPPVSEPATTEPATTEPGATEPATTEPATTEPVSTEPATTEPASTEPAAVAVEDPCPSGAAASLSCWRVAVPIDPAVPDDATIDLAVTVERSDPAVWQSPILWLGGPLPIFAFTTHESYVGHDKIWVDHRGVGRSASYPQCTELDPFLTEIATLQMGSEVTEALGSCVQATVDAKLPLASVIDPNVTVADLAVVRRALGIDQWSIGAQGAGLDVALRAVADDPDSITSIVAAFPAVAGASQSNEQAEATFATFAADCAAAPDCAAIGDLNALLDQALARVEPGVVTQTVDPGTGSFVVVNDDVLVNGVNNALSSPDYAAILPSLIAGVANGSGIDVVASAFVAGAKITYGTDPVLYALNCQEVAYLRPAMDTWGSSSGGRFAMRDWQAQCDAVGPVPQIPALPTISSSIPVFAVVPAHDPRSSVEQAEQIFSEFPNTTIIAVPGISSVRDQLTECWRATVTAFLDDPTAELDTTCLSEPAVSTLS